jgi:hypothetical protein
MTMEQRAGAFNMLYKGELTAKDVRDLYRGGGVTKQQFKVRLGPPKPTLKSVEKQRGALELA